MEDTEKVVLAVIVVIVVVFVIALVSQTSDCWTEGGEMVRGLSVSGYVCVERGGP